METEPVFQIGDLVTRDGTDVQRVTEADEGYGNIKVVCVKEPMGYLNENGTRDPPWCRVGDVEDNLSRRYSYAGDVIDVRPTEIKGLLVASNPSADEQ